MSAVARVCTLDRCENVTLCAASNYLRIGNCVDCTVYSYTQIGSPVIYGDTRSLTLAPHNASYPGLVKSLNDAGIETDKAKEGRLGYFARPILMRVPKQSITLQLPVDFMKLSLPSKFYENSSQNELFLCPPEFE